jgi:hypothetical protein
VVTAILYLVLGSAVVLVAGGLVVLFLVLMALRSGRFVGPTGRPPGGGTAGVREPLRPRPHPPSGAMAMPVPPADTDEVAWA